MIIKIKVSKLINMIKIVSKIIKNRKKESILSYILIKIIKKKIFCISINEEIEIVTYEEYDNYINDIEILIRCDFIYEICRRCEEDSDIFIKKNKNSIEIKINETYFMFPNTSSEKFPCFEHEKEKLAKFKIESNILYKLFSSSLISLSENNIHEFLNGIYLEVNENLITTFSSDGERFIFAYDYLSESNNNVSIILSKQTINEVINLTELTKHVYITITKKYIRFISNNITITSKLIKDIYELPDLNIEQDLFVNIELEKNIIKKSLYKINFLIKENKITFEFEKNNIKLYTQINNEKGIVNIKTQQVLETTFILSLNNKHFSDILKYMSTNLFFFIFSEKKNFIIIKEKESKYIYTLIPF